MAVLIGRLAYFQIVAGPSLAQAASRLHQHIVPLTARRGEIVDRNGVVLAVSRPAYALSADPHQIGSAAADTAKLAPLLAVPASLIQQRLALHSSFVWVDRSVSAQQAAAIRALRLPGIDLTPEDARFYPQGMLLGPVLGFVGLNGHGLDGLELSYDRQLAGRPGYARETFDALGNPIPAGSQVLRQPQPGLTLRLTVDTGLQFTLHRDLEAEVALTHARQAWGVVMDPSTGAVLALSVWPTFDPNHFASVPPALWTDPVVSDTFTPGSVFKPITASGAIAAGVVNPSTPFTDPGFVRVDGVALHDFQPLARRTDLTRALEESANVVYAKVGLLLGRRRFYQNLRAFGLFAPTGVDLPGEPSVPSIVQPEARATPLSVAEMSFGESLAVTPLALMTALNAVADGGRLIAPRLVSALLKPDGQVAQTVAPHVLGQAVPASVTAEVRTMMRDVVLYGTGQRGFVPCYDVGGKTGTANIYSSGKTLQNHFYGSFYEFAPLSSPRVAVLVTIVDAKGPFNEGGEVAAPVAQDAMRAALHDMGVAPACTAANQRPPVPGAPGATRLVLDMVGMPSLVGLSPATARAAAQKVGLRLTVTGPSGPVLRQNPPAGSMVQRYTAVDAYTQADVLEPGTLTAVPDLHGLTLEAAAQATSGVRLNLDATGVGRVVRQSPPAGSRIPVGSSVTATLAGSP